MKKLSRRRMMTVLAAAAAGAVAFGAGAFGLRRRADEAEPIRETEREGEIRVTSHRQGDWILIHVADNGVGIPNSQIAHIYDPFFTTKEPGKGTGLGLFTCYRTVTRHGGEISVDSQVGGGTAFHVSLPIRRELVPGA